MSSFSTKHMFWGTQKNRHIETVLLRIQQQMYETGIKSVV